MNISVNASRENKFSGSINHSGASGNDQMTTHLLDPGVFNIDVGAFLSVVVDHGAIFDQETVLRTLQMNGNFFHGCRHFAQVFCRSFRVKSRRGYDFVLIIELNLVIFPEYSERNAKKRVSSESRKFVK